MMLNQSLEIDDLSDEIRLIVELKGGAFFPQQYDSPFFDSIFLPLCKRYQIKSDFCSRTLYSDQPRPVHVCFIFASEVNAFAYACPEGRFDFVGINFGAVFTLLDIFSRLMSHPEFLVDVGDVSLEDSERSHAPFLYSDIIQQAHSHEYVFPNCPIRSAYCSHLLTTSLDFLFFHEIAHLRNGHCDWKRIFGADKTIDETHQNITETDGLISKAFEFDADAAAIIYLLNQHLEFIDRNKSIAGFLDDKIYNSAFGNKYLAVRLILISVYMLFRIFNFTEWDVFRQKNFTHPQPPLRQGWIVEQIFELFLSRQTYGYDCDKYRSHSLEIIGACEKAVALILRDVIDARGILSAIDSDLALEHRALLIDTWKKIRPDLLRFKRGGRLAP